MKYIDLQVYQRSLQLAVDSIKFVESLPNTAAIRVLINQLIRSVTSIAANIAEGSAGSSKKEFANFLQISLKSAIETEHWFVLLNKLGHKSLLIGECREIIRMLHALVKKMRPVKSDN